MQLHRYWNMTGTTALIEPMELMILLNSHNYLAACLLHTRMELELRIGALR